MVFAMMRWWYGRGWLMAAERMRSRASGMARQLSAGQLVGSLFEPWHRIVSVGGRGLSAKFQDALSNGVSRGVGFVIRLAVLFTAGVLFVGVTIAAILEAILWPLLPLALLYCLVRSVTG